MRSIRFQLAVLVIFVAAAGCSVLSPAPVATSPGEVISIGNPTHSVTPSSSPQQLEALQPASLVPAAFPSIWVTNPTDRTIVRIDPVSNAKIASIDLGGEVGPFAFTPNGVWVVEIPDKQSRNLIRIDTNTNTPSASIPVPSAPLTCLADGAGGVWGGLAGQDGKTTGMPGSMAFIDPSVNVLKGFIPLKAVPAQVVPYQTTLWVLEWMDVFTQIEKIEPTTGVNQVLPSRIETTDDVHQFSRIAVNSQGIWAASVDIASRYIYRLDHADGRISDKIQVGEGVEDNPVDLVATDSSVWVALRNGVIVEVDANNKQVINRIGTGYQPDMIFAAEGGIWALSNTNALLTHIDPLTREIVAGITTGSKARPTETPLPTMPPGTYCVADYEIPAQGG